MTKKNESLTKIKFKNFFKNNKFLIVFLSIILILGFLSILIGNYKTSLKNNSNKLYGDDVIEMYYFHLNTCPHCHEQNKFMENILFKKYPNIRIHKYEMTKRESNLKYIEMAKNYSELNPEKFPGTPLTIIGNEVNIGFGSDKTTGVKLISMVEDEMKKINENWNSSKKRTIDLDKIKK